MKNKFEKTILKKQFLNIFTKYDGAQHETIDVFGQYIFSINFVILKFQINSKTYISNVCVKA